MELGLHSQCLRRSAAACRRAAASLDPRRSCAGIAPAVADRVRPALGSLLCAAPWRSEPRRRRRDPRARRTPGAWTPYVVV